MQDIHEFHFVSQGKTEIPGVDDGEELEATDVSMMEAFQRQWQAHARHPPRPERQKPFV